MVFALVALCVTLVVIVVAIVVVVLVRGGDESSPSAGPSSAAIDSCVVGAWQVTAHREDVTLDSIGNVTFTGKGTGASVRLAADGSGVTDYGSGSRFEGVAAGQTVRLDVTGKISYRITATGDTVSFLEMTSNATGKIFVNGDPYAEAPFDGSTDPASYTCSGDMMTEQTAHYRTTLTRTG